MNKLLTALTGAANRIWNWRKYRKFKGYEKAMQKALLKKAKNELNREVEQAVLKNQIIKHVGKFLNVKGRSSFIPPVIKSNEHIRQEVYKKFGLEMDKWGVSLKKDLTICTH